MALRFWTDGDFANDEARRAHSARSRDAWEWVGYCYFWLLGRGASESVHGEPYDSDERHIAERERLRHGWTVDTVEHARNYATSCMDPIGKVRAPPFTIVQKTKAGKPTAVRNPDWVPGPTVGRDLPDVFASDEESAARVAAILARLQVTKESPKVRWRDPRNADPDAWQHDA